MKRVFPFDWLDITIVVVGAIALRLVIPENDRYLLACFFYGFMVGVGRVLFKHLDEE